MSIKGGQPDEKSADRESLVCWNKDNQSQALRVETDGKVFVFPFSHFLFAVLDSSSSSEELRVSLTTHDVKIRGRNLGELTLAFQKLAVDWIRAIPSRFVPLAEADASIIEQIEVTELQSEEADNISE